MSIGTISDRNAPIRIAVNQTLARQTPKSDFGTRMKAGAAEQSPLIPTLEGLVGGFTDICQFARMNRPDLVGDMEFLRTRLEMLLVRAKQAQMVRTSVRIP